MGFEHLSKELLIEGLPIPNTISISKKDISKMNFRSQANQVIRPSGDTGANIIPNFATAINVMARSQLTGSKVFMSGFYYCYDALNKKVTIKI